MAKKNKYWGLVAIGALTAAAAGVVAAEFLKKDRKNLDFDDDFDDFDDFDEEEEVEEAKVEEVKAEGENDFISWEAEELDGAEEATSDTSENILEEEIAAESAESTEAELVEETAEEAPTEEAPTEETAEEEPKADEE